MHPSAPGLPGPGLRAADLRFLLAGWPHRVAVGGLPPEVAQGLTAAGHLVVDVDDAPDAVLCTDAAVPDRVRPPAGLVVLGRGHAPRRALRARGLAGRDWLLVPGATGPLLAVPARAPRAGRTALEEMVGTQHRWQRARNALLRHALARGVLPPLPVAAVWSPDGGWPALPGAGGAAGPCVLSFPGSEDSNRVVAVVPGAGRVVKAVRRAGGTPEGLHEQRALQRLAPPVAGRAPQPGGAGSLSGAPGAPEVPWTTQTRAPGGLLLWLLQTPSRRAEARRVLDGLERWLVDVARAGRPESPAPVPDGLPPEVRARLAGVPAVAAHHDLGSWNVVVDRTGDFTVLDWEDAGPGLPLGDLLYLLTDCYAHLDGAQSRDERTRHALDLHRGRLPASTPFFASVRRAAADTGVDRDLVGSLALGCWAHHAGAGEPSQLLPSERLLPAWLQDPDLGPDWPALSRSAAATGSAPC